jgi:hypothetical protein
VQEVFDLPAYGFINSDAQDSTSVAIMPAAATPKDWTDVTTDVIGSGSIWFHHSQASHIWV